jgi:hypothetical protein
MLAVPEVARALAHVTDFLVNSSYLPAFPQQILGRFRERPEISKYCKKYQNIVKLSGQRLQRTSF